MLVDKKLVGWILVGGTVLYFASPVIVAAITYGPSAYLAWKFYSEYKSSNKIYEFLKRFDPL